MPSTYFTRSGAGDSNRFVVCVNGNSNIYFDTNYGGAPLRWNYPYPGSGTRTEIIILSGGLPYPGAGFQSVTDEGQDLTQASANGLTERKIARTGIDSGLELARRNYYCRESTTGYPTTNLDEYIIVGFFPDFWASIGDQDGPKDDAIPPNSHGEPQMGYSVSPNAHGSGWTTGYTSPNTILTPPFNTNTWGTPVQFSPYNDSHGAVYSGILMEGNQQKTIVAVLPAPPAAPVYTSNNWNERLRSIPYGRVAFRIKVSLKYASDDSYGGVLFRKSVPTSSGSYNTGPARTFMMTGKTLRKACRGLKEGFFSRRPQDWRVGEIGKTCGSCMSGDFPTSRSKRRNRLFGGNCSV